MPAPVELKEADEDGGLELVMEGGTGSCRSLNTLTGGSPSTDMGVGGSVGGRREALRSEPEVTGYLPLCCYPKSRVARRR